MTFKLIKISTLTATNTDHLVHLFKLHYPYNGVDKIRLTTSEYKIVVQLFPGILEPGIYAAYSTSDIFEYESTLSLAYLIDAISYVED